ncbi:MAG: tatC [Acidimicrobiia bacterium]|nr:tatC [Acidimicrobiia bacterium]
MKIPFRGTPKPVDPSGHMTLFEHLAELRTRLLRVVLTVAIATVVGYFLYPRMLHAVEGPFKDFCKNNAEKAKCPTGGTLVTQDLLGGFTTRVRVAGYFGLIMAVPVILWQIWRFIAPGLVEKEKKYAIPFMVSSLVLFAAGAYTAWWTFPKAMEWLINQGGVSPLLDVGKYFGFLALLMLGYGIGFEFPVILVTIQLLGIITPQRLAQSRRMSIVVIAIVAAVITPGGDPFSMLGLGVPLVVFYEVSILIGRVLKRGKSPTAA